MASLAKGLQWSWPLRTAQCQECIQEERGCRSKKEHLILSVGKGRERRVDIFVFHNQQRGNFLIGCLKASGTGLASQSLPVMRKLHIFHIEHIGTNYTVNATSSAFSRY